jgi:hypothetical protein
MFPTDDVSASAGNAALPNRRELLQSGLRGAAGLFGAAFVGGAFAADAPAQSRTFRRVVTANNAQGKSYFLSDQRVSGTVWETGPGLPLGPWDANEARAPLPSTRPHIEPPVVGGIRLNTALIAPSTAGPRREDFHRTSTIDLIYIAAGRGLTLLLDEGETVLNEGDVVIQRNTMHAWRNLGGTGPITLVAVMVKI